MFRSIVEDYEAKLTPPEPAATGTEIRGKAEWERYGNGEEALIVRMRNSLLPDGAIVDVTVRSSLVGRMAVKRGRGELRLESRNETVPHAVEGDVITLSIDGKILLQGIFIPD